MFYRPNTKVSVILPWELPLVGVQYDTCSKYNNDIIPSSTDADKHCNTC